MGSQLPIPTLFGTINALEAKGDQAIEKSEQFYIAAGLHLKEALERKPKGIPATYIKTDIDAGTVSSSQPA